MEFYCITGGQSALLVSIGFFAILLHILKYLDRIGSDSVIILMMLLMLLFFILSCYNLILLLFFLQDVIRSPLLAVHPRRENLDVFFNLLLPLLPLLLRAAAW